MIGDADNPGFAFSPDPFVILGIFQVGGDIHWSLLIWDIEFLQIEGKNKFDLWQLLSIDKKRRTPWERAPLFET